MLSIEIELRRSKSIIQLAPNTEVFGASCFMNIFN